MYSFNLALSNLKGELISLRKVQSLVSLFKFQKSIDAILNGRSSPC